jgi:hypothetical protein
MLVCGHVGDWPAFSHMYMGMSADPCLLMSPGCFADMVWLLTESGVV